MKKLLIALAVATVGCSSQSLVGPTATSTSGTPSLASSGAAPDGAANGGGSAADADSTSGGTPTSGRAPRPEYSVQGPLGCVTAGTDLMQWVLTMTDAGPSQLRFVALAHQALEPGCDATVDNPRSRVSVSGVSDYRAHTQGQTIFGFDPRSFACGRVQVDVSSFDAQGRESLLIGMVVNYGRVCQTPPPVVVPPPPTVITALQCSPGTQTVAAHQSVNLSATGGNGVYAWSMNGTAVADSRSTLTTSFPASGEHVVTVASAGLTATCVVVVESAPPPPPPPPVPQLLCTPSTSSVLVNQSVTLQATGGTGAFAWSATGGTPAHGSGASFATAFASSGSHSVFVTSGQMTATCIVTVTTPPPPPPPPVTALVCAPNVIEVRVGQPVTVRATGGNGTYAWSVEGGTPASGSGASFMTTFNAPGSYRIWVRSGGLEDKCKAEVSALPEPPPPAPTALLCEPRVTTTLPGRSVTLLASGGSGGYVWNAAHGTPSSGSGASFTTSFSIVGDHDVIVTSGNEWARCKVEVERDKETVGQ